MGKVGGTGGLTSCPATWAKQLMGTGWGEGTGQEGAGRSSLVGTVDGQPEGQPAGLGTLWGGCLSRSLRNGEATQTWGRRGLGRGVGRRGRQSRGGHLHCWTLTWPDIVDIKPANMEDLTEVITASEFHPHHCNLFVYSSSKGSLRLCDMRAAALCDKHSKRKCPHPGFILNEVRDRPMESKGVKL